MAMKLEYVKVAHYDKPTVCPHNSACRCSVKECHKCGWHPKVEKLRMQKILGTNVEG